MKSAFIAGISAIALSTSAYAATRDIIGGREGAVTIHNCPNYPLSSGNYASPYSPTSARIVQNKLASLGYVDTPGKGRKHRGAVSALAKFQRDMNIQEKGAGPLTAMALAQATATDHHIARCLQLSMK